MNRGVSMLLCCACLSKDRKLLRLCRINEGVNIVYMLLMSDTEAYKEGFFKDTASWMVCWECSATIRKIKQFQIQMCNAMKQLKNVADGKNIETELKTLSQLTTHTLRVIGTDTFIDVNTVHIENTEQLSQDFDNDHYADNDIDPINSKNETEITKKIKTKYKKFYKITVMDDEELKSITNKRKLKLKNEYKCITCMIEFNDKSDFNDHNIEMHTKKENHRQCDICLAYIDNDAFQSHTRKHYKIYVCNLCEHTENSHKFMVRHLKEMHRESTGIKKKTMKTNLNPDKPVKYKCTECDMSFGNKGAKWKHVQKTHRAGHTCATCQKVFAFKHNLQRHELSHSGQQPVTECLQCHKAVRTARLRAHAAAHVHPRPACAPCGRAFSCRATYENHLKYARAHANQDARRHACPSCEKRFRSRGELHDHIAYRHEAQARHKCLVCDKSLATKRCLSRHVKRAHEGIKENAKDKMCDYCGKAFRYKKSLSEHVWRHTGARPLSCARCGRAFRQRAALHAHVRRLHPDN